MLQIGLREANQHFAHYIETVESGEEILITRHGKPVAKIVPTSQKNELASLKEAAWERIIKSMRKGYNLGGKGFSREEYHAR